MGWLSSAVFSDPFLPTSELPGLSRWGRVRNLSSQEAEGQEEHHRAEAGPGYTVSPKEKS